MTSHCDASLVCKRSKFDTFRESFITGAWSRAALRASLVPSLMRDKRRDARLTAIVAILGSQLGRSRALRMTNLTGSFIPCRRSFRELQSLLRQKATLAG